MKKVLPVVGSILISLCSGFSSAVPIINGGFDNGLAWNDASGNGSTSIGGGVASLTTGEGTDTFSAVLVQGDNGFFDFDDPISLGLDVLSLSFDVRLQQVVSIDEPGFSFFTDTLSANVYDAVDESLDLLFLAGIDFDVTSSFSSVILDISSLAGRSVAFSFELSDEDDLFDTTVFLDNVKVLTAAALPEAVPEPGVLLLFSLALAYLLFLRRKNSFYG